MPTTVEEATEGSEEPPLKEEELPIAPPSETATAAVELTHQAFIPPLEYLTHVPPELLPPLFPLEAANDEVDGGNHPDDDLPKEGIYQRLIASTTRSAMLANQLAEVNRTLGR